MIYWVKLSTALYTHPVPEEVYVDISNALIFFTPKLMV